jgi:hypothetical protein
MLEFQGAQPAQDSADDLLNLPIFGSAWLRDEDRRRVAVHAVPDVRSEHMKPKAEIESQGHCREIDQPTDPKERNQSPREGQRGAGQRDDCTDG